MRRFYRFKWPILILIFIAILSGTAYLLSRLTSPQGAALYIDTNPISTVFINNEQAGQTPFEEIIHEEEVVIKLVPNAGEMPLAPYETKVKLTPGVKTIVRRTFGETPQLSSGEEVSFEKVAGDEASLAVVSNPDAAEVKLNGVFKDFTPTKITGIDEGEQTLNVSAKSYLPKELIIRPIKGYTLTAVVKLATDPNYEEEPVEVEEEIVEEATNVQEVEIGETGVGFLRVREEPTTLSDEIGRVEPGERYELVEEDAEAGWYKIIFNEDQEGWVSSEYAEIVEEDLGGET